jgi:ABC-type proline/glycine betaine transport system ATPase subunit
LKQQLHNKEQSNLKQIAMTDELRQENKELKAILTRLYYGATKVITLVKTHDMDNALKLGKIMYHVKSRFIKLPHRN